MADGYARISRKVGVCGAQAIGSTNLAAGLRDAYMARTPVIALSGVPGAQAAYRNLYQDVDDHGAFEAVTKWNATGARPRPASPTCCGRRSAPPLPACPGRCTWPWPAGSATWATRRPRASPGPSRATAPRRATARWPSRRRSPPRSSCSPGPGARSSWPATAWPARARPRELVALAEQLRIPVVTSLNGHGHDRRRPPALRRRRRRVRGGLRQQDPAARRRRAGRGLLAWRHDHQDLEPDPGGRAGHPGGHRRRRDRPQLRVRGADGRRRWARSSGSWPPPPAGHGPAEWIAEAAGIRAGWRDEVRRQRDVGRRADPARAAVPPWSPTRWRPTGSWSATPATSAPGPRATCG